MEIADSNMLPFLGMIIETNGCELVTRVYRKPTNNGLLLHVDMRYKKSLIRTMLHWACHLSPSWKSVIRECDYQLKGCSLHWDARKN